MIKVEELMIGDWVMYNPNVFNEDEYEPTKECFPIQIKSVKSGDDIDLVIEDCYSPIPLTPEILEKNGFAEEVREGDPTFPYSAFILDGDDYHIEITWYDSHDRYEPNTGQFLGGVPEVWVLEVYRKGGNVDIEGNKIYVHDLQHALKLCKIDKEIKL